MRPLIVLVDDVPHETASRPFDLMTAHVSSQFLKYMAVFPDVYFLVGSMDHL